MSFLRSIATDFVEKRLWPFAALLAAALVAVLAYVAMSGGGQSAPPAPVAAAPTTPPGPAVSEAPANPNEAIAETTTGQRYQRQSGAHDPFASLGGSAPATAGAAGAKGGSNSGTPVSLGKATASGGASALTPPSIAPPASLKAPAGAPTGATTAPSKPSAGSGTSGSTATHPVEARFGVVPTTTGPDGTTQVHAPTLTDHKNLARLTPLPDAKSPVVVYMGVRPDGKTATFALMHEAILRGDGACRPSALKCQLIDLRAGQKEQLDYVTPSLQVVRYELDVVAVGAQNVAQSAAVRYFHRESSAGRALLKADFPPGLSALTYSYSTGALQSTATAAVTRSATHAVTASDASGSPAYAPALPHAGPPVVQPGWLGVLLHAL